MSLIMSNIVRRIMRTALRLAVVLGLGLIFSIKAHASPAPWFRWESRMDARHVCAQTSPGEGWRRMSGPWRDAGCRFPLKASWTH